MARHDSRSAYGACRCPSALALRLRALTGGLAEATWDKLAAGAAAAFSPPRPPRAKGPADSPAAASTSSSGASSASAVSPPVHFGAAAGRGALGGRQPAGTRRVFGFCEPSGAAAGGAGGAASGPAHGGRHTHGAAAGAARRGGGRQRRLPFAAPSAADARGDDDDMDEGVGSVEQGAGAGSTGRCSVCTAAADTGTCFYCEKAACGMCTRQCALCHGVFCSFCSTVNYAQREERELCLSCNAEEPVEGTGDGVDMD